VARPLWKGAISFGLVTIPVQVFSATRRDELRFRQLDRRDNSPVREKRVNAENGREVPWEEVVRGYEYEEGSFVILEPEDFTRANVKASETISCVCRLGANTRRSNIVTSASEASFEPHDHVT